MTNDRDMVLVSLLTLCTVLTWIFFELIQTVKTTTIADTVQEIIAPFDPALRTDVLGKLENRVEY